ncbi:hypothetical protein SAMN06265222_101266 [Neorhodopirellula lusitana]|uniref:Transcription factor zinc-finger domain-containing protein n=2 Tax=Neorhodopirellula lusitana TaxID=445327 RepID=A0ABY1PPL0_9BACT|nr:hypothetical protein SAMN06265222_101266 [Neorhodopirellula lusitana]
MEPEPKPPFDSKSNLPSIAAGDNLRHHVSACPICGGGLCGVRAYFDSPESLSYGLVICDECEAIWLQPDTQGVHVYADAEAPVSPVNGLGLYDPTVSRWANAEDIQKLGWSASIDDSLTYDPNASADDLAASDPPSSDQPSSAPPSSEAENE